MAINKKNTDLLKSRFKDYFGEEPDVMDENVHGCDGVTILTDDSINLDELNRFVYGIGNTMTLSVRDGKLRISVW